LQEGPSIRSANPDSVRLDDHRAAAETIEIELGYEPGYHPGSRSRILLREPKYHHARMVADGYEPDHRSPDQA
jgi:hypothetical protein